MSHLSHPIKTAKINWLYMGWHHENQVQLHKAGCAHEAKAEKVQSIEIPTADDGYSDDWYYVAPCARKA